MAFPDHPLHKINVDPVGLLSDHARSQTVAHEDVAKRFVRGWCRMVI